jgi:hypothetical protein
MVTAIHKVVEMTLLKYRKKNKEEDALPKNKAYGDK